MTDYQKPVGNIQLSQIHTAVAFPTGHPITFFAVNRLEYFEYLVRTPDGCSRILTCYLLFQQHCQGTSHHSFHHITSHVHKCPNKLHICCHRSDCPMSPICSLKPAFGGGVTQATLQHTQQGDRKKMSLEVLGRAQSKQSSPP